MRQEYDVLMGDNPVGRAVVEQKGLYFHFHIRCNLSGDVLHKVLCRCEGKEENLGVLVPVEGSFGLDTRKPIKQIGEGELRFVVLPRHLEMRGRFVPLSPDEPFRYIARLKDSYLARRGTTVGIMITEPGRD